MPRVTMDDFDDEDPPPALNTGSVYDLAGKPRRGKKNPIGFVHFNGPKFNSKKRVAPKAAAKKPQRKARRK